MKADRARTATTTRWRVPHPGARSSPPDSCTRPLTPAADACWFPPRPRLQPMRAQADLPRRRSGNRNRIIIVAVIAVLFVLVTSLRGIASFYTTYLWFGELKLTSVWKGVLG